MEINCASIQILVKSFFNKSMNDSIKDIVLFHIIKCKDCQKHYKKYAKEIGLDFDIKKESALYIHEHKNNPARCSRTKEAFIDKFGEDKLDDYEFNWEYYAQKMDLKKLMNLKCVNDFTQESFEVDESDPMCIDAFADFGRYMTTRFCKIVDSLERCYNMEINKK